MDILSLFADRIGGRAFGKSNEVYKFVLIKKWKTLAESRFSADFPMIDMGVGEPDIGADSAVVNVLAKEAMNSENRFYSDNGIDDFKFAAIYYMKQVYGVDGLTINNIIHGIGSKSILAMLPQCFVNEGDYILQTLPGYPIMATHTKYLGGRVFDLPLTEENDFYPDFTIIPRDVLSKAKMLYINYPNNPTGQTATREFFAKVIEFAKTNNIIVVHDAAYAALVYDEEPLSFLAVEGAIDVGVEIHSMSKAFNMTGWRMGFVVGNEKIVSAYGAVKDNTDSGQFRAIQKAAGFALQHTEITKANVEKYARRFELLVRTLNKIGFNCKKPKGTFYCYVKIPYGTADGKVFKNALETAEYILMNAKISVVPWDDAGHYLRFSVTYSADTIKDEIAIMNELERRLSSLNFIWR